MPKYLKPAAVFGAAGAVLLLLTLAVKWSLTLFVLGIFALGVAAVFLLMMFMAIIGQKKGRRLSGWRLFAIGDTVLMLIAAAIGAVDLITSRDAEYFGPGTLGTVIFYYGLPVLGALLLLELFVWKIYKQMKETSGEEEQSVQERPQRIAYPPQTDDGKKE
ncbi:MAG: hypothetical protein IJR91_05595 [Ruminococcus sp.]|nr:hypothetical protein [Ruminococcus sp.]